MLNTNDEIWLEIPNWKGIYYVSNLGRVKNNKNKIMKSYKLKSNYLAIKLGSKDKREHWLVHRLVLSTFNPNKDTTKTCVNHINENKQDNRLENLEWVNHKTNNNTYLNNHPEHRIKIKQLKNWKGKKKLISSSKYHNVTYDKSRDKWITGIANDNKKLDYKRFNTEEEAAIHVNKVLDKYKLTDRPKNIIS